MLYKITMRKHACLLSETMSPAWKDTLSEAAKGMGICGTLGNYMDGCGVVVPMQCGKPAPDHPSWTLTTIIYMSTCLSTAVSPPSKRLRFSQNSPPQVEASPLPVSADPPEVAMASITVAPSINDNLSVFDILNIFRCHWFISRQHLVDSVLSA